MKAIVCGAQGQLGVDLAARVPDAVECIALKRSDFDICDTQSITAALEEHRPDVVINTAAYTAVDLAESEESIAHSINATGAFNLAQACQAPTVRLVHLSTDYVFDGSNCRPYEPDDVPNPRSVYGATKLAGEEAINSCHGLNSAIVRVSWLYGNSGANFVKTMLRLMRERKELGIVADQIGSPTWTGSLADCIWKLAERSELQGAWHWSDLGVASWYDFAVAINEIGSELGLLEGNCVVKPILTREYPTPAARPHFSVLESSKLRHALAVSGTHWRHNLIEMLKVESNV